MWTTSGSRGRTRGRGRGQHRGGAGSDGRTDQLGEVADREAEAASRGAAPQVPIDSTAGSVTEERDGRHDDQRQSGASLHSRHLESEAPSASASRGGSSVIRKRQLELAAAEERAKIRKLALREEERIDLEVADKRLQLQLAELSESEARSDYGERIRPPSHRTSHRRSRPPSHRTTSDQRIQDWVDAGTDTRHADEREPVLGNVTAISDMVQLASAITRAIEAAQERTGTGSANQRLVTRLTASRDLPAFDGDPLEWPRFKLAFEASTTLGRYSDDENVSRLFNCLKKEARDAVAALMIVPADLSQIMETLQLRFGNPELVARKIGREIKRLPHLGSG